MLQLLLCRRLSVILTALLCGCDPSSSAITTSKPFMQLCPGFVETGKAPLVFGAECGELTVNENPADLNSPDIKLSILRLPAISPAPALDPLFLIQGGPGGSSVDMATQIHGYFADVRKNRDLIFVDQRGTGKSNPLTCDELSEADAHLLDGEQTEKYLALMKACALKYQDHIPFYTTPYAVQDLDAVRIALGYERINLWGASYGTRVALEYARQYPQHARTMVLDGVAPTAIALPKYFSRDAMAALTAVNAECMAQPECVNEFGDIAQKAQLVVERLRVAQQVNKPIVASFEHPRYQRREELTLTPKVFSSLVFMSLYSRDLTVLLPRAISQAAQDDFRLIAALSALVSEKNTSLAVSEALHFSVVCNEDWHFVSADDIQNLPAFLGMNKLQEMSEICAFWPKGILPETYWEPIKSDVPALVLSGKRDPVTPVSWADSVIEHLSNATSLMAAGGNHVISTEGCLPQLIAQFIEQGNMHNIKTDCVQQIKPLPLVLGAHQKSSARSMSSAGSQKP